MNLSNKIKIITKIEQLLSARDQWNELLSQSPTNNVFLTWEWIYTWSQIYGHGCDLYVLLIYNELDDLIGIAPFKYQRTNLRFIYPKKTVLSFIGSGEEVLPESLDIIYANDNKNDVFNSITEFIFDNKKLDTVDLYPISNTSEFGKHLIDYLKNNQLFFYYGKHTVSPFVKLPEQWDIFLSCKSKNFKKKSKEYQRIIERDLNAQFQCVNNTNFSDTAIDILTKLHQTRWQNKSSAFRTSAYINFHKELANRFAAQDWLRLFFLLDNNEYIAGCYCFFYNRRYYYYQSGRDLNYSKYRVGFVLMNYVIQFAIQERAEIFDFLTGDEPYKYRWADNSYRSHRLIFSLNSSKFLFLIDLLLSNISKKTAIRIVSKLKNIHFTLNTK